VNIYRWMWPASRSAMALFDEDWVHELPRAMCRLAQNRAQPHRRCPPHNLSSRSCTCSLVTCPPAELVEQTAVASGGESHPLLHAQLILDDWLRGRPNERSSGYRTHSTAMRWLATAGRIEHAAQSTTTTPWRCSTTVWATIRQRELARKATAGLPESDEHDVQPPVTNSRADRSSVRRGNRNADEPKSLRTPQRTQQQAARHPWGQRN
jgi:hypothetical protein